MLEQKDNVHTVLVRQHDCEKEVEGDSVAIKRTVMARQYDGNT